MGFVRNHSDRVMVIMVDDAYVVNVAIGGAHTLSPLASLFRRWCIRGLTVGFDSGLGGAEDVDFHPRT